MTSPDPLPSLSELQAWPTEHFDAIADWCDAEADRWESSFTDAHQRVRDADWVGQGHDTAVQRLETDLSKARGGGTALRDTAKILRMGAENERFAKAAGLRLVAEAQDSGYVVGEDLVATDTVTYTSWDQATARRAAAREFTTDIRTEAASLVRIDRDLAARLPAASAELQNVRFTASSGVQIVGHGIPRAPGGPFPEDPQVGDRSIRVDNSAIDGPTAPLPAPVAPDDPRFNTSEKSAAEKFLSGTTGRADGELAVGYLRARGWDTAGDLIQHYLANESDPGSPSKAKPFQLSTAQTDALAHDVASGYAGAKPLPSVLENARESAIRNAAQAGDGVYTEVYGTEPDVKSPLGPGWNPAGGTDPNNVYGLGRYSVQVVTQVDATPGHDPVVRQRYFVYDYTDFEHNAGTITHPGNLGHPVDAAKMTVIDELATLRDIGWARGFDTYGTSSIQTYPR